MSRKKTETRLRTFIQTQIGPTLTEIYIFYFFILMYVCISLFPQFNRGYIYIMYGENDHIYITITLLVWYSPAVLWGSPGQAWSSSRSLPAPTPSQRRSGRTSYPAPCCKNKGIRSQRTSYPAAGCMKTIWGEWNTIKQRRNYEFLQVFILCLFTETKSENQ